MKILHKSKRAVPPPPPVVELITKLQNTTNEELANALSEIAVWKWQRSDLNAWIKVLNKFDVILEEIIRDCNIDKLQTEPFTPMQRSLLFEILRFERLLLENSTNRKMYNSYDRLNSLLFTSDLDVLILTLKLLLRPSQQYSAQPAVSQSLSISTPRLQSLAKRWPQLREYSVSLVDLAVPNDTFDVAALPAEAREVHFSFYRTEASSSNDKDKPMDTDTPEASSSTAPKSQAGAVPLHIDESTLQAKSEMAVLADAVERYSVPDCEKFELLCRIRAASVLQKGREGDREKVVVIRLLAIAIFGHTHPETQASSSIFLYEPDLIIHVAELLHTDKNIPSLVQTAAVAALDALARYRSKMQEVLTSVNAGVNHGILMGLLRKTVADITSPQSSTPNSFVEALLAFLSLLASHAAGGNMVVGAGLIPLLIQILENRHPDRLPVLSKAMQLVDNVLYSFTNAFNLFCTSRGVDVLVERIEFEINHNIKEHGDQQKSREIYGSHTEIPVARAAVLKHILRSMHRMMQSSGTSEGLRGLIDTSILKSIKKIIEYRGLFGASVLPIAINIMATFVHNEPTSLVVIQEAGLPEAFYKAIELGLEPAIEVIQAIPNAIGALCLNEVGQAQLTARPSIIPSIFSIFTSDRHLKVLLEKENAVLMGTTIDELIRHHPQLKAAVFESIRVTLSKIEDLGNAFEAPEDIKQWYKLMPTPTAEEDITMEDIQATGEASQARSAETSAASEEPATKAHDNHIVSFIDVLGRFLEGLFQHAPHCKDFMNTKDGMASLGRLTALPCLPYDYANSIASDSMVQIMRTMTEAATSETLLHLATLVKESLQLTQNYWSTFEDQSKLLEFVDLNSKDEVNANYYFRNLVTLHIRITLLSDVFATAGYAHGRQAIALLQTLMTSITPQVVKDLGALHRTSIWENIVLKMGLAAKGIDVERSPPLSLEGSPDQPAVGLPESNGHSTSTTANGAVDGVADDANPTATTSPPKESGLPKTATSRENNATALKHMTNGLPSALAPFFQAMVKMFHARRAFDASQRKQMAESSAVVAEILLQHLTVKHLGDKPSTFTYYSIVLGLMTLLLVDERTASSTLHTVQLLALYRANGLEAIFDVCQGFISSIDSISSIREDTRTEAQSTELGHAYGGLKVALHLIHPIISSKPLFESGQTPLLITRDMKDTDPQYFEPHNFLVRLRTVALPFLSNIWEAKWLVNAPLTVSRFVVQAVLELVNGDGEELKGDSDIGPIPGVPRATGTDENRIRQLTDMGFPRSAAERALVRTHNNVNAATELLLAHPYPFPPDPEPEAEPTAQASSTDAVAPSADDSEPALSAPETPEPVAPLGKTAEEWRAELNEARESLRAGISRQALALVDEHLSLIFDLHVAFVKPAGPNQVKSVQILVDDIKAFSPYAYDVQEQPLANRCRLLALVLCETPGTLGPELRATLMDSLLALLLSNPVSINTEQPTIPRWLAAHLLVTEALFTLADEPRAITLPKEDEPIPSEPIPSGPALNEARTMVFDFCLRLLAIPELPSDELLSTLRLLVLLTRDHSMASQFVTRDGLDMLFRRLKSSPVNGSSSYIATILRHIVEDASVVSHIMHQSIKRYFTQLRGRVTEPTTYVRNCSAMALRNAELFVETTQSLCQVTSPYSSNPHLSLKAEAPKSTTESGPSTAPASGTAEMQVDSTSSSLPPSKPSVVTDAAVHYLIGELIAVYKSLTDERPETSTENDKDAGSKDKTQFMCFMMQCLTELLFSYDSCKSAFLSFSPKKPRISGVSKDNTKHRTHTLSFFLNDLVAYENLNAQKDTDSQNRMQICNWAMSVLVALCVDSSSTHEPKEVAPSLVSVRKTVLDAISRTIKDLPSSDSLPSRYGRLLAIGDLCHRLLTVRFNHASSRKQHDDGPTHIAKVMLEKGFVSTLTGALSEVDLNYPNVRTLVQSIMRPLEHLTKVAIKMSRASSKSKDVAEEVKSDSEDSMDSDESDSDDRREETPDLYRNSALGIYAGEMDGGHPDDDDMEDDEDDMVDEDEMDFGDETGSDDTSNTDEEGDDDEEMDEPIPQENDWENEDDEEDEEDDLVHNEGEGREDEDDEDDEDDGGEPGGALDDEDAEILWQDMHGVNAEAPALGEDGDEDDEVAGPIHIIHEDEEDEPEMASDEDDFGPDMDGPDFVGGIFGFTDSAHDGAGIFVPRRHRSSDENVQVFGRPRNGAAPPPEATTHPLLLDASATGQRSQSRLARAPQGRFVAEGGDILQTIEQLVGGGAFQFFQQIMARGGRGGAGPEQTIRLDVPPGTLMNLDRGFLQRRQPIISASVRVERNGRNASQARDLDPLLTLQRWTEEVKILHGDFVSERVVKLANHVTLALLPAAVEAAKQAKIQSDELARQKEEQAKAAAEKAAEVAKAEAEAEAAKPTEPVNAQTTEGSGVEQALPSSSEGVSIVIDHPMEDAVPVNVADTDTEMIDGTNMAEVPTNESAGSGGVSAETTAEGSAGESSTAPARVTVLIHGNAVDITDTGIDPTFLEALPDDMREEVLNQHIRDQRAARVERPPDSHISAEFLDALPPELRAEIIQQEAIERSQRRRDNPPADNAPGPTEIDPASFIASLDPNLRQAILLDQDDGFIQTLPSHMIAEAGAYREGLPRAFRSGNLSPRPPSGSASRKQPPPPHDAIQLLDRQGVAILVRLLFFPQVIKKNLLFKVLLNLCENAKTRTELFNLLLNILQDGTGDLTAVDKSFAQMSFRNSKPVKAVGKQKASSDYAAVLALPSAQNEAIPDLIAQRCLDALVYIVTANGAASLFFLTEHEVPAGLRRAPSKKGKGKEKQMSQTHYPIVLLLGLLDRQSLLRTPSIVESVVGLLATVTRPLSTLKENKKTPIPSEPSASSSTIPPPETASSVSVPAAVPLPQSEGSTLAQGSTAPPPVPASNDAPPPAPVPVDNKDKIETVEQKILLANPPQIPHVVLRFIVNILTVGECSARTFQQSLALIQHLSNIPDARDVIAQELKNKAQEFGQSLLMELDELATALLSSEGEVLVSSVASKFSAPSSVQAKLLRVLKTIDYMYSPRASNATPSEGEEDTEKVQGIYESFRFTPLWKRLGDCLAIIEEKSDTEHVATVLLPLIEALMVVCKYVGPKSASSSVARALRGSASPKSPTTPAEAMEDLFVSFTDAHRKILNLMVRNNPSLMSGSFSLLVHNPRVLDFDNKRNYFSQQLHRRPHAREHHSTLQLNVRRARVFEDSFQHLQRKTGDQIKYGKLSIRFYEEEGVDAGGLTREWFQILARQMFDPNNALFQPCAADKLTYQPNKNSWVNPEHLSFFKFVGRVIGKAIYDGRLLDAYFARSLYRQILGKPVDYKDVEWVDPEYYNSLCWILENDPTLLELTFSVESDEFGVNRIFDLKEGGASIPVTQENKREFVQLSAQFRLYSSIQQQIEHLLNGFYEIIPKDLINIFNEQELELLISGTPDIDVDEWRAATEYNGYTSSDPNIVWWWRALKSFNREERAKVLSFATGTSRVPLNGFNDLQGVQGVQKFSIHRAYGESDRLPQAHTCFNQIDLPQYSSYDMLRQQVLLAISEGGEGFGFV